MPHSNPPHGSGWPIAFWQHHPVKDQDARALATATLEFQNKHPFDVIKVTPAGTYHAVDDGLADAWCDDPLGRRTILEHAVHAAEDWATVAICDEIGASSGRVLAAASMVRAEAPGKIPVVVSVFSPLTQAVQLAGHETFRRHMLECPQMVRSTLTRLTEATVKLIEAFAAAGLDGIYFATQHMANPFFSPEEYAQWGSAFDQACIDAAATMSGNVLHAHGNGIYVLPTLDPAKWAVHYELAPGNPPLGDCMKSFAGRLFLGIPAQQLEELASTPSGVEDRLDDLARTVGERPVVLSVGCVLPIAFPVPAIERWLTTARNHQRLLR